MNLSRVHILLHQLDEMALGSNLFALSMIPHDAESSVAHH